MGTRLARGRDRLRKLLKEEIEWGLYSRTMRHMVSSVPNGTMFLTPFTHNTFQRGNFFHWWENFLRDAGHEKAWLIRATLHRAGDIRRRAEKRNVPLEAAASSARRSSSIVRA